MTNKSVEAKIRRLTREIGEIDEYFYGADSRGDRDLYAGMLERKRDDMVRSVVLQLHTGIEDMLNTGIMCAVLDVKPNERQKLSRSASAQALHRMLRGGGSMGFDLKLNFAVVLRIINSRTYEQLAELNKLRNRCSHNWLLKAPVRRGKRPKQKKPPLLLYKGSDLHRVDVLKGFMGDYGALYARLFLKFL